MAYRALHSLSHLIRISRHPREHLRLHILSASILRWPLRMHKRMRLEPSQRLTYSLLQVKYLTLARFELRVVKLGVKAALFQQLPVGTLFHYVSRTHDE